MEHYVALEASDGNSDALIILICLVAEKKKREEGSAVYIYNGRNLSILEWLILRQGPVAAALGRRHGSCTVKSSMDNGIGIRKMDCFGYSHSLNKGKVSAVPASEDNHPGIDQIVAVIIPVLPTGLSSELTFARAMSTQYLVASFAGQSTEMGDVRELKEIQS